MRERVKTLDEPGGLKEKRISNEHVPFCEASRWIATGVHESHSRWQLKHTWCSRTGWGSGSSGGWAGSGPCLWEGQRKKKRDAGVGKGRECRQAGSVVKKLANWS
ncbi:hypothetical protein COCC4DRAFT_30112 [Bipolaris maydis ATCC 48331]|uniref:Uncharacterized protein n=1 Tax=Cochliobolus heterostrophus (strain C4 / ATCC 48331 / race T) TaxID=665024 RepID=N4XVR9_COCH4|nr:uncharacterized protein COCC4DRAFT_30112 [Bipolaris maydis ATCC 48331]ENI09282.1 hypothetical protein COCC4DRAFT_30112 [Bipolaris maydis ATCC 48331]